MIGSITNNFIAHCAQKWRKVMKKTTKKIVSLFLLAVVLVMSSQAVCSAQNINVTTVPEYMEEDEISTYDIFKPTQEYNLLREDYHFSGSAELSNLYTNYYFTGVNNISISVNNKLASTLYVKIIRLNGIFSNTVDSTSVYGYCNLYSTFKDLDPNEKYCILFVAPCEFNGYVTTNRK